MTNPEDWKHGLRRLRPGVYCDSSGKLHLDEKELLVANGYAPTEANAAKLREAAREMSKRTGAQYHEV